MKLLHQSYVKKGEGEIKMVAEEGECVGKVGVGWERVGNEGAG